MRSDSGLDIACSEREWSEGKRAVSASGVKVGTKSVSFKKLNKMVTYYYWTARLRCDSSQVLIIHFASGTSVHSPEGSSVCCSPHQDSLSSIPEQDRRSEPFNR